MTDIKLDVSMTEGVKMKDQLNLQMCILFIIIFLVDFFALYHIFDEGILLMDESIERESDYNSHGYFRPSYGAKSSLVVNLLIYMMVLNNLCALLMMLVSSFRPGYYILAILPHFCIFTLMCQIIESMTWIHAYNTFDSPDA